MIINKVKPYIQQDLVRLFCGFEFPNSGDNERLLGYFLGHKFEVVQKLDKSRKFKKLIDNYYLHIETGTRCLIATNFNKCEVGESCYVKIAILQKGENDEETEIGNSRLCNIVG